MTIKGVEMDISEAEKRKQFIETSADAENDIGMSQTMLAMLYYHGTGVSQSKRYAHVWFNIAAANYFDSSHHELNKTARDNHMEGMTPKLLAEAKQLAELWIERRQSDRYFLEAIESLYNPTNN